jgi:hypothetical protein
MAVRHAASGSHVPMINSGRPAQRPRTSFSAAGSPAARRSRCQPGDARGGRGGGRRRPHRRLRRPGLGCGLPKDSLGRRPAVETQPPQEPGGGGRHRAPSRSESQSLIVAMTVTKTPPPLLRVTNHSVSDAAAPDFEPSGAGAPVTGETSSTSRPRNSLRSCRPRRSRSSGSVPGSGSRTTLGSTPGMVRRSATPDRGHAPPRPSGPGWWVRARRAHPATAAPRASRRCRPPCAAPR